MATDPCQKCGSVMLVHRASTVQGVPVITVRCVYCKMEREIRCETKPEKWREMGAI